MKQYPFKIGEWVDEPIEIKTVDPVLSPSGRVIGTKEGKKTVTQRVHYSELSEPHKLSCADKTHNWYIPDPHDHVAKCSVCPKRRFIRATYEMVKDGQFLDRDTGERID